MSSGHELPTHLKNCSFCGTAQHKTNKYCVVCLRSFLTERCMASCSSIQEESTGLRSFGITVEIKEFTSPQHVARAVAEGIAGSARDSVDEDPFG